MLREEQHRASQRDQAQWFTDNVTGAPLTVRAPVDFIPDGIRSTDAGGFDAPNRVTMLSRRPRSAQGRDPKWDVPHYVWSTTQWDWAAGAMYVDLDSAAVDDLQQRLHPGEPVDRGRRIDPPDRGPI
ncbi:hypothetical protein [Rhodococcus qingshengii]|uniref:hypothetical protein n=1 Tax=Rhodococcus qingshengii TaxID=334542 RepID=UPI001BE938DE|nr:hypothetical protein [Rhodococcus qingshengii]MBT2275471.1 hypothetical protein [Rhodococcus qingshengii]